MFARVARWIIPLAFFGLFFAVGSETYAQVDQKDWDTRDYERKYFPLVRPCGGQFYLAHWTCGARQT